MHPETEFQKYIRLTKHGNDNLSIEELGAGLDSLYFAIDSSIGVYTFDLVVIIHIYSFLHNRSNFIMPLQIQ